MSSSFDSAVDESGRPLVVIIDDQDQGDFAELVRDEGAEAVAVGPDELDPRLLTRAALVVLDQYLDIWPMRDQLDLPPTLHVSDGIALAAVLRSQVERSGSSYGPISRPVAFALRTGEMDRLGAGMPKGGREYLLARQYNLEWVFNKGADRQPLLPSPARQIAELARATSVLPLRWTADSGDPGLGWLGLPNAAWTEDARWQIEQCRPPQHVVAERTAGLAWLRWFLHRILPFPTFLLDSTHLAVTLGIDSNSIEGVIGSRGALAARLDQLRYRGPLSDFLGYRWWRAGVNYLTEELLDIGQRDGLERIQAIGAGAIQLHGSSIDILALEDPVIGVDADYSFLRDPLSAASAVRLQPDDWPPYADDAWASRDSLNADGADPELLAMVVSVDRWRVRNDEGESDVADSDGSDLTEP